MPHLGLNIDHVATIRQARYRAGPGGSTGYGEPDVIHAALEGVLGGAECITAHLREDRRHVIDRDIDLLRATCGVKFNLEMAGTDAMIDVARRVLPHQATLVPEGRQEVTTEGGLNVAGDVERWKRVVGRLADAGIAVSAFIDPDEKQIDAAKRAGFVACEIHTGRYAHAFHESGGNFHDKRLHAEFAAVAAAGEDIRERDMQFNAGHALSYVNVRPIAHLPGVAELHIGHAIISRAVVVGLRSAVREMKALINLA